MENSPPPPFFFRSGPDAAEDTANIQVLLPKDEMENVGRQLAVPAIVVKNLVSPVVLVRVL